MRSEGFEVPELDDFTDLFPDLVPYWNAWIHLDGSRQVSFGGAGAIPVSEIRHYCDLVGTHSPKERKRLMKWVQLIDRVFLGIQAEKQERKNNASGGGKGGNQPPSPRRKRQ